MALIKYPIGIQNFERLIEEDYLYVDKTAYIRQLVENGIYYFISRPRRFGKSLVLSTLHAFFEGKRKLFKGLAIDSWDEWDWMPYPVIHIDLNAKDYTYKESLFEKINAQLIVYEEEYEVSAPDLSLDQRFSSVIRAAYAKTGKKVVVLIDEYDKPMLDTLHDDVMKNLHRDTLRAFYATLKSSDQYLRFCFLTGVTKFGQMNVFSGLNNIQDISLRNEYAGICGITEDELHKFFDAGISSCADEWGCTKDEAYKELKKHYDGYHFSKSLLDVYNPWSVLNAVKSRSIEMYWNMSGGGMAFLYKLLEADRIQISNLDSAEASALDLFGVHVDVTDAIAVLYQTGYLTIKSYDRESSSFTLKYPNLEVETGFLKGLLPFYSGVTASQTTFAINHFVRDIRSGDVAGFMERMQSFFDDFPYENALKTEKDFQNIFYCIGCLIGFQTKAEVHSSRGRADLTVWTSDFIYIFEFKIDRSPEEALHQIADKGYAGRYAKDSRRVIRIGVEFSTTTRNITRWKIAD